MFVVAESDAAILRMEPYKLPSAPRPMEKSTVSPSSKVNSLV